MQDLDGHILAWNRGAERLYGYSEAEALQMNIRDLVPEDSRTEASEILEAVGRGEDVPAMVARRKAKDGHMIDVLVSTTKLTDDHGRPVAVTTTEHDITERKRSEAALRRLATVLQDSNDAITMQDLQGRILAWNRGAERMYGYSEHEALQMNIEALIPDEERERARGFLHAIERGEEVSSLEVTRKTKDGRVLDVWLTTTKLVDDEGNPVAVATTERDVTQRKQSERERERLLKEVSDALQARDEFLSIASHELKNPLGALNLKLDLILRQARNAGQAGEKLAGGIESAIRQSARLTRLIDELLDISRITSGRLAIEREDVNLSQLIPEVEDRLRQMIERGGSSVQLRVQPGVTGRWDRLRVEQVLVNLLTNAVKYGGRSPIEVSLRADGRQATIEVRDHGPGISEADQSRIFERFVRAAPRGVGGLGLGLYITRQIVEAHGGRIRVESRPGEGAAFVVELPLRPPSEVESG